jgi:hypothetical protein
LALAVVGVERPAVVRAFEILSIEVATVERHAAVRTGVAQGERAADAIASDHERNLEQHGFIKLIAVRAISGQSAIPEAGEHQRVRRLALGGFEFGHADCLFLIAD